MQHCCGHCFGVLRIQGRVLGHFKFSKETFMANYKQLLIIDQWTTRFIRLIWGIHKMTPLLTDREGKRYQNWWQKNIKSVSTLIELVGAEFLLSCGHSFGFFVKKFCDSSNIWWILSGHRALFWNIFYIHYNGIL